MINIGQYIETAINWLTNHFATFFDTLSIGIGGFFILSPLYTLRLRRGVQG